MTRNPWFLLRVYFRDPARCWTGIFIYLALLPAPSLMRPGDEGWFMLAGLRIEIFIARGLLGRWFAKIWLHSDADEIATRLAHQ